MSAILAYVDLTIVGYIAIFIATLVFSTKIKDFFTGVPADLRAGLSSVETGIKADVKNYQASLVAKIAPAPIVKPVVAAPAAPAAPVLSAGGVA